MAMVCFVMGSYLISGNILLTHYLNQHQNERMDELSYTCKACKCSLIHVITPMRAWLSNTISYEMIDANSYSWKYLICVSKILILPISPAVNWCLGDTTLNHIGNPAIRILQKQ